MSLVEVKPILIIGAGPTGLSLALALAKNGISVRVVEKRTEPFIGQRGGAIMPRTLELHKLLGTLSDVLRVCGRPLSTDLFLPHGRVPVRTFDMAPYIEPTPDRPYPNPVMLWQSRQEEILRVHLAALGVHVEFGVEMEDFEHNDDRVIVTLVNRVSGSSVKEIVETPYLVSAEGAHSTVRKMLQLTFHGETTTQSYVIGDIEVLDGLDRDKWYFCGETSSKQVSLCAGEDPTTKYMYMLFTGAELDCVKTSSSREALIEEIYAVTGRCEIKFGNLLWLSSYTPNIRTVEDFSKGRCFVAGDAAHIFALSGAQGLNSGIHDSVNLAWKLANVVKGISPSSLLETYGIERLPVIAGMLEKTIEVHKKTHSTSITDENSDAWDRGGDFDMLHMHYRGSPIVVDTIHPHDALSSPYAYVSGRDNVRAGDRAPDAPVFVHSRGTSTIFDLFGIAYHTVLIFSKNPDMGMISFMLDSLSKYPSGSVRTVVILPQGHSYTDPKFATFTLNIVAEDQNGNAYASYLGKDWAIVEGNAGITTYFDSIFV
ncbi:Pentachlorophenol 4-monooxygenase [Termitomyces sp. T112]|nr:Pentachlorophenol 4-monooxygenase [Termitomyces sp. T112]